jgi:hypothetical protein
MNVVVGKGVGLSRKETMKFIMEEFWNDNLNEGIIADVMYGNLAHEVIDKPERNIVVATDNWLHYCEVCDMLWEPRINVRGGGIIKHSPKHIPKLGKKHKVCEHCL